jgi:hypothetical protein
MEAEAASAAARAKGVSMSSINERNTRVNFQNALQNVSTRDDGSSVGADGTDVFARRKTASRNYWSTNRHGEDYGQLLRPSKHQLLQTMHVCNAWSLCTRF